MSRVIALVSGGDIRQLYALLLQQIVSQSPRLTSMGKLLD
jgi:hypothetical protein